MDIFQEILPVVPMIIMVTMIVITKRLIESAIVALILSYIVAYPTTFYKEITLGITTTLSGGLMTFMIAVVCVIGVFIRLIQDSGSGLGFGKFLAKFANTQKKSLIATYILGLIIFIDEYLNAMVVTSSMRNLTDRYKVPRVMLSMTVNAAGVPACILIPISAWAAFYIGLLTDSGLADEAGVSGVELYMSVVPFMFYPIALLLVMLLVIIGVIPKTGRLKRAFERAESLGDVYPESGKTGEDEVETEAGNVWFFIIPLVVACGISLYTADMFMGVSYGILLLAVMLIVSKKMTIDQVMKSAIDGIKDMSFVLFMLLILFTFTALNEELGFAAFAVEAIGPFMNATILPAAIFIIVGGLAYLLGGYFATMALCLPIVIELTSAVNGDMILSLGALMSAAVFPATCAFTSESIILAAQTAQIKPVDVALVNLKYALLAAGIAIILYIAAGALL